MQTITGQQILVPKKVYIGDTAELRCSFNSGNSFLKELTASGTSELSLVSYNKSTSDYDIKSISLSPAGVDFYQLTVTFTPWKTGQIQLPSLELENAELLIEFQPVQIVSLISTDSTNAETLRDTAAPLLLPGTTYKLYAGLAVFVIFLIVLTRVIIKRESLLFYLRTKRLLRKYKKNKKQALRSLRELSDQQVADSLIAEKLQKLLRSYLEVRFDFPFTKTVTSEMMQAWQKVSGGLLSDEKTEAFGEIAAAFIRTDFIRYSNGGSFEKNELVQLVEKLITNIDILETEKSSTNFSSGG